MKGRVLVLDAAEGQRSAAALMVNGVLEDLIFDPPEGQPSTGDILQAKVTRVLGNKGGAFCEMAGGTGFLRDARGLASGDRLPVQVVSLPERGKAITVSQRVLHKGPRLILTPGAPGVNVSRQIRDPEERDRLQEGGEAALAAEDLEGCGLILRSAAEGEEGVYLQSELARLAAQYRTMIDGAEAATSAAHGTALRDWLLPDARADPR